MLYMPVWKLEELQTVGADVYARTAPEERNVLLTQEEIKERYKCFGGIIRYVISTDNERIGVLKSSQDSALSRTQPLDIYISGDNIEKVDERKENVSHFVLHYDVYEGECAEEKILFQTFRMCYASAYVQKYLHSVMTDQMLLESIDL